MNKLKIFFSAAQNEPELLKVKEHLEKENHNVFWNSDNESAFQKINEVIPHLIIICRKNDSESIDLCFQLRENPQLNNSFIFIISSQNETYLQVAAYNSGADDYILKPINARALCYKIKSLLKRISSQLPKINAEYNAHEEFKIDREQYLLKNKNGKEITLPRKEFELLSLLMTNPKKVFKRDEIIAHVWHQNSPKNIDRTIDVHIRRIREKIGDKYIKTVKGIGYSFQP